MALKICHINAGSLVANFTKFKIEVHNKYDIITVSESWLGPQIDSNIVNMPGYRLFRCDRITETWGGGIAVYVRTNLSVKRLNFPESQNCEQLWLLLKISGETFGIGTWYRPPGSNQNTFLEAFEESLSIVATQTSGIICLGDINIDQLDLSLCGTRKITSIFESFDMIQIINEPTRITNTSKKLLDIIGCSNNVPIKSSGVQKSNVADHCLIHCDLTLKKPKIDPFLYTFRDFRNFDRVLFDRDIQGLDFSSIFLETDIDVKLSIFNQMILNLFYYHAPIKTVKITRPAAPWLTDSIKLLSTQRDRALSRFKKNNNPATFDFYKTLKNQVKYAIKREKKAYLAYKCRATNKKTLWEDLKKLDIYSRVKPAIPNEINNPEDINNFFINISSASAPDRDLIETFLSSKLNNDGLPEFKFSVITEHDILNNLTSIKSRAVGVDQISVEMLLRCCPHILTVLKHIFDFCILFNVYPNIWKQATVIPIPKNSSPEKLEDLRPVSILCALSKVFEKSIEKQIRVFVDARSILPESQSGFRKHHSCITAMAKVTDDILKGIDDNRLTVLVMIDYSKAFDKINHTIFLALLNYIGFSNGAVDLTRSYLCGRTQSTRVGQLTSSFKTLASGVAQGSVLGPLFFTLYTSQFPKILQFTSSHSFADDSQVYKSFFEEDVLNCCEQLNQDLNNLVELSSRYCLDINPNKSQVMLFGRKNARTRCRDQLKVFVNDQNLQIVDKAKNLGIVLDTQLNFEHHISLLIKRGFSNLKMIYSKRGYLNKSTRTILCDSLVLSHLNYGDVIYDPRIRQTEVRRLQLLQNACVRLICGLGRRHHISTPLHQLSWLNMKQRRFLHSSTLYHKVITHKQPYYLYKKISFRYNIHGINTRHKNSINIPRCRTVFYHGSFTSSIARTYNKIPHSYKCFKSIASFKNAIKNDLLLDNILV